VVGGSDWCNNCAYGCRAGTHSVDDVRDGHGLTTEWRVSQGYTCRCQIHFSELDEWHDHLVGNEKDQQRMRLYAQRVRYTPQGSFDTINWLVANKHLAGGETTDGFICNDCGAVVAIREYHNKFHDVYPVPLVEVVTGGGKPLRDRGTDFLGVP